MHISRRTALIGITATVPLVTTALAAPADAATPSGAAGSTGSTGSTASSGSADSGVLAVQRWLNTTFGHLHGWVHVDEDGLTGSGTVLGIVQATQSLLGISPVVATFGPTTRRKLEQHGDVGAETGDDAATWRRLVQAGLVCKGASTVSLTGEYDAATVAAVQALRSDLGAEPGALPLSAHLFGALLTVDPVRLASGGSRAVRAVQQYLNRTYAEATGGAYGSTSGLVDTSTYSAAIRAVQVAVGVTVDGAWGPGTAAALRAAGPSVVGVGATGAWVLLVKALLVLNGERVVFSSAYSAADAAVVRAFQQFQAFPPAEQTGTCDAGTWAALAASTGDPDRATTGVDTAVRLDDARAAAVRASGATSVGRYLTNHQRSGALDKALTPEELRVMASAGLGLWPIFEEGGFAASWFTEEQGVRDAHRAHDAARKLGIPKQTTVYFAADFDATSAQDEALVVPYFRGVAAGLRDRGNLYKAGVYGSRATCTAVSSAGLAHFSFVAGMSPAWSGNQLEPLPGNWSLNQIQNRTVGSGNGSTEIDAVVDSGRDPGVPAARLAG
ncbi:DUF1906 domain-containing protein [Curtobacterium flaccumfaciens pv. flaccumfaciens]|uniref:glycoside hydrolase domain-containing protein n=1 Tax=Curtobacterium flaccumfaciens TaxID=2035 RepID=UPI001ADB6D92|nr:glycoside hydrolase domain-containing protein [Curtobacterium flaccumfaciens]MBO9047980.1 DUF1906 domain-containing protein [Curtobacterium flaccumfaciens pv. flaccumfaciens]MBO9057452.1 DUF1906 domain-containing protein [Curtobacterium flaccumfaciens pv. flaccumfaciens]QTR90066.1 DUF1906 domain-containing protein [Curtobacterium flaccumfaciens pv. flaccumfaciens]QVG65338.1 DUF1906 domain-containing protein [Curtobacterium flaccumfaciens pv. flaccumfaciens]